MNRKTPAWLVFTVLLVLVCVTRLVLPPHISSDSTSYLQAMKVVVTGQTPQGFVPNRILTTYLGLEGVLFGASVVTGDILVSWYLMNALFYIFGFAAFFYFLRDYFEDDTVAWLGTLLLATSYGAVGFGLNYLMDMGGWAFYLVALWASYRYYLRGSISYFVWASLFVGVGGLFKEYAFLAFIPLFVAVVLRHATDLETCVARIAQLIILVILPPALVWWNVYQVFGYSYATWFGFNQGRYGASYVSRIIEYIKVFGSLFTFAWFLAIPGLVLLLRRGIEMLGGERMVFLTAIGVSGLPVFLWPAITQRVFFVTLIFLVMLAALAIKRYERWVPYFLPLIILYVITNYAMDAYVLPWVSLDKLF